MRKSSVSKQSKHSSCSAAVSGCGSASRRANFLCQRATSGAPSAMRSAVARASAATLGVGHDARDETLLPAPRRRRTCGLRAGSRARRRPDEAHERRHFRIRHHEAQVLDRRAEAARSRRRSAGRTARRSRGRRRRRCRGSARPADGGTRRAPRAVACITAPYAIACALFARSVANSPMSLPGRERLLAGAAQRRCSAARRRPTARRSRSPSVGHIAFVSALSFSGRLSTTVAMGAVAWRRRSGRSWAPALAIEEVDETEAGDRHVGDEQQHRDQHER